MIWKVYFIFFLSGAVALIFETLWFRLAGLVLGNSIWGAAMVLSGFMAGLAMGNYLVAQHGHNIKKPMHFYALLEITIGISGCAIVFYLPALQEILVPIFRPFLENQFVLNSLRLSTIFFILIIPTAAMGATLPIMVKSLLTQDRNFGSVLGGLYGINTFGAVLGTLLCEVLLISYFGIKFTGLLAAMLNFSVALLALQFSKSIDSSNQFNLIDNDHNTFSATTILDNKKLLFSAFLAGSILLALEIIWFRFLQLFVFGTSLVFALMLATVLIGISAGGIISSYLYKRNINLSHRIQEISLLAGICALLTYFYFDSFYLYAYVSDAEDATQRLLQFIKLSLFLMLPVSVLSGVLFSAIGKALKQKNLSTTSSVGLLTFANTFGAMCGAFISGFILLPIAGMENSFLILSLCYGFIFIVMALKDITLNIKSPKLYLLGIFIISVLIFPFGKMENIYYKEVISDGIKSKIIENREGLIATNFYLQYDFLGLPLYHRLVTNGHSMSANNTPAKRYMKFFVYWPVAIHPNIENVLLISYGIGSTAKALVDTEEIKNIDVVDISSDVLDMSKIIFPDKSEYPLNDSRVKTHIEDGRFYLLTTDQRYDLITAEPPPPSAAHVVNLYSQDYFQLLYEKLNDGGITTYWLPVHILQPTDSKSIIKAFCNVFTDCSLWSGAGLDWVLAGSKNLQDKVSEDHFSRQWQMPRVKKELTNLGLEDPVFLGTAFIADSDQLETFVQHSKPVTDNFPHRISPALVSREIPNEYYYGIMYEKGTKKRFVESKYINRIWPKPLWQKTLDYFDYQRIINIRLLSSDYKLPTDFDLENLHKLLTQTSLSTLPKWILGDSVEEQLIINKLESGKDTYSDKFYLQNARHAVSERNYNKAVELINKHLDKYSSGDNMNAYPIYLYSLCMAGHIEDASILIERLSSEYIPVQVNKKFIHWLHDNFGTRIPDVYL